MYLMFVIIGDHCVLAKSKIKKNIQIKYTATAFYNLPPLQYRLLNQQVEMCALTVTSILSNPRIQRTRHLLLLLLLVQFHMSALSYTAALHN